MEEINNMKDYFGYNGKVCVVTGASSGMGKAAAEMLVDLGAKVYALDYNACPVEGIEKFVKVNLGDKNSIDGCFNRFAVTNGIAIRINTNRKSVIGTLRLGIVKLLHSDCRAGIAAADGISLSINLNRENIALHRSIGINGVRVNRIRIVVIAGTRTAPATAGCQGNCGKHSHRKFIKF